MKIKRVVHILCLIDFKASSFKLHWILFILIKIFRKEIGFSMSSTQLKQYDTIPVEDSRN